MNVVEIDKNSWHGRLTTYVWGSSHIRDTPSICPYFWSVVCAMIVVPFYWVTQQYDYQNIIRVLIGIAIVWMFIGIVLVPVQTLSFGLFIVGWITVLQIVVWGANAYMAKYPHVEKPYVPKPEKKKQESLLSVWLKARKDKVCPPIIEV